MTEPTTPVATELPTEPDTDAIAPPPSPGNLLQYSPHAGRHVVATESDPSADATSFAGVPSRRSIEQLHEKYGIAFEWPADDPAPIRKAPGDALRLNAATSSHPIARLANTGEYWTAPIGQDGTRVHAGRVFIEPTAKYGELTVRGYAGRAGLYEKLFRSETQIFDAVTTNIETQRAAIPFLEMPRTYRRSNESALRHFIREQNARLLRFRCLEGSWPTFMQELATAQYLGFATCEPQFVRGGNGGQAYLFGRAEPRRQMTVDGFIQADDELVAIDYMTHTDSGRPSSYSLPVFGPRAIDRHVILLRVNGFGNNWPGLPATRPATNWVGLKQLIVQVAAVHLDKWANPVALLKKEPQLLTALEEAGLAVRIGKMSAAHAAINNQRAADGAVHWLGNGIGVEMISPTGTPPALQDWLAYIDRMVGVGFTNEGNLRGFGDASSYAISDQSERRSINTALAFTHRIEEVLNTQIFGPLAFDQIEGLVEAPRLRMLSSARGDAGQFHEHVLRALGPNPPAIDDWPEPLRVEYFRRLGMPTFGMTEIIEDMPILPKTAAP